MSEIQGMINAAKVAEIWNERARIENGVESHYTRFSARTEARRNELDAIHTPIGWLYSEEKVRKASLRPRDTKRPDRAEANKTPFKRKNEFSESAENS